MGDAQRREDERAAHTAADEAARARWIVSRLRAGDLEPARVRLAALAGDPAAAAALGREAPRRVSYLDGAETADWPVTAWCAAAVGAARLSIPVLGDAAGWGQAMIDAMDAWLRCEVDAPPEAPAEPRASRDGHPVAPCRCCGVRGIPSDHARTAVGLAMTMPVMLGGHASQCLREVLRFAASALEHERWERHASAAAHEAHGALRQRIRAEEQALERRLKPLQRAVARAVTRGRGASGREADALREQTEAGRRAIAELTAEADRLAAPVPPFPVGGAGEIVEEAARRELAEWALRPGSRFEQPAPDDP